jgi:tRNA A-37 threonylcarbamoyl transferase component Bud32
MRTLSKTEYEELLARSKIIEQDGFGVKVLLLPDGNYLKTFWFRRVLSSRRLYPECLRFVLHAKALKRRSIATVDVVEQLRIPHLKRTAVLYRPLAGRTLRQIAAAGEFDSALAGRLGAFIAELHRKGIHFHSLHLGNVLLCPDGGLGLIDISNMRVFLWPLRRSMRMRNFVHLLRYAEDVKILAAAGIGLFADGYLKEQSDSKLKQSLNTVLKRFIV